MKWRYGWEPSSPAPAWLIQPDMDKIKEIVQPHLTKLGFDSACVDIIFLREGSFNKVYTFTTRDLMIGKSQGIIFKTSFPVSSCYKTESDAATTELARNFTNIPFPAIHAFDSFMKNPLGLEWMLMEKIAGKPLMETWL